MISLYIYSFGIKNFCLLKPWQPKAVPNCDVFVFFVTREFCVVKISVYLKLWHIFHESAPVIYIFLKRWQRADAEYKPSHYYFTSLSLFLSLSYGNVQTPLVYYRTSLSVPVSWLRASWLETLSEQPIKTSLEIRRPLFQHSYSPVFIFGLISKSRDENAIMSWCLSLSPTPRERKRMSSGTVLMETYLQYYHNITFKASAFVVIYTASLRLFRLWSESRTVTLMSFSGCASVECSSYAVSPVKWAF